eukprot:172515-Chlamydomonas_euryale.AAC.2
MRQIKSIRQAACCADGVSGLACQICGPLCMQSSHVGLPRWAVTSAGLKRTALGPFFTCRACMLGIETPPALSDALRVALASLVRA